MDFVQVKGKEFYFQGKPILFAGLGVGSWLNMEHFMMGMPGTDKQIRETFEQVLGKADADAFFEAFVMNFMTDADFAFLKECGVNLIRVPFNYRLFLEDENPGVWKEEGFRYLDRLLGFCRKYQIFLMPDLHTAPGGQNPDWHSDNTTGIPQFWHFGLFQDQMVELWKRIAARYRDETYLLGYDLLNEPFLMPKREGKLNRFFEKVTRAIREVDENHIIFIEGDFFSMDFTDIIVPEDEQTAITFHFYPTVWDERMGEKDYDPDKRIRIMDEQLSRFSGLRERFGRPALCGEAGVDIKREDLPFTFQLIEEDLALFKKHRLSWTLWSYKDSQWMGLAYPKNETPWVRFTNEIRALWSHRDQMQIADELMDVISSRYTQALSRDLKYELQFQLRGLLYRLETEYILKPVLERWDRQELLALPESFRFENCECYQDYRSLLQKYAWKETDDKQPAVVTGGNNLRQ